MSTRLKKRSIKRTMPMLLRKKLTTSKKPPLKLLVTLETKAKEETESLIE